MGKRGRVPQGKLNIVKFKGNSLSDVIKRPNAPYGMGARARNLFKKIVHSKPPGTYGPLEITLLRALCEAENLHYLATQALNREGIVLTVDTRHGSLPRRNPHFDVARDSAAMMKAMSAHLKKITGGKPPGPKTPGRKMYQT